MFQAVLGHHLDHAFCFRHRAHEGNHDLYVRQSHLFAHAQQGCTLERKTIRITRIVVTRSASEAEHWIFFFRLKLFASEKTSVLIGFKIACPNNHGFGIERGRNASHTFAKATNKKLTWVFVAKTRSDLLDHACIFQIRIAGQGHWMDPDVVGNYKLCPGQPHAVVGDEGHLKSASGIADRQHHLCTCSRNSGGDDPVDLKRNTSGINMALGSFRTGNCDFVASSKYFRRVSAADDAGNPKLTRHNRSVGSSSALICDDGGNSSHHRFPIRIGMSGNKHISGLYLVQLGSFTHHANTTGANLLPDSLARNQCWSMFAGQLVPLGGNVSLLR